MVDPLQEKKTFYFDMVKGMIDKTHSLTSGVTTCDIIHSTHQFGSDSDLKATVASTGRRLGVWDLLKKSPKEEITPKAFE